MKEFCDLVVAANTVRKTCYEESGRIDGWQANDPAASQSFRQAPGEVEFTTDGTLDVFYALEHVSDTAKSLFGEGAEQAQHWNEQARDSLITKGWPGIAILGRQQSPLKYAQRLTEARPIGSGMVEGACKHLIGSRMKQTGARWRIDDTGRMASICSLQYSNN